MKDNAKLPGKEKILTAAIDLFSQQGYDNVSINTICSEVGISKTTFYYYFRSKEDIIIEYLPSQDKLIEEKYPSILMKDTALEQYWAFLEVNIAMNAQIGRDLLGNVYVSYLKNRSYYLPHEGKTFEISTKLLEKAQQAKQVLNMAPGYQLNEAICHMLRGVCFSWTTNNCSFDLVETCKENLKNILNIAPGFSL